MGDQTQLKKEKFFEDFYQNRQEMFTKKILKNEKEQVQLLLKKYSHQRIVQFEEIVKKQRSRQSVVSRDSCMCSNKFDRRIARIGESDSENSNGSEEMKDVINDFFQVSRQLDSQNVQINNIDQSASRFEKESANNSFQLGRLSGSELNSQVNMNSYHEKMENRNLRSQTKRLLKRNENLEGERVELQKDIQNQVQKNGFLVHESFQSFGNVSFND